MTTISEILNGAERELVERTVQMALVDGARYGKGRLTGTDFRKAIGAEVARIAKMEVDKVISDSLANLDGWRGDAARTGWEDLQKLEEAARETLGDPAATKTVTLLEYSPSVVYESTVDVYVVVGFIRHRVAIVRLGLKVTLNIADLGCTVWRGRLIQVLVRAARVGVTLYLKDVTEVSRETEFAMGMTIPLGDGIALIGARAAPREP